MTRELSVGDSVPHFTATDTRGRSISPRSITSQYTLFVFLRYSGCPFCNLAMHRLAIEYSLLKRNGCEVVAFIQSTEENIEKNIFKRHNIPTDFSVIADHDRTFYRLFMVQPSLKAIGYGVRHAPHWLQAVHDYKLGPKPIDGNAFIVPAFFLADRKGSIVLANHAANFYDDTTFTPIYEALTFHL